MLSIFTTTKDFIGEFDNIQQNAINSWRSLSDEIEIMIMGRAHGAEKMAKKTNAIYFPDVPLSESGMPTLPGMFNKAQLSSKYNIICFINADIILPYNFLDVITNLKKIKKNFLAVGHRWDYDIKKIINFNDKLESEKLWDLIKKKSVKQSPSAIDYFIFNKKLWHKIPELVIARQRYDNWLIWKARRMGAPVIDLSDALKVAHQNHSYNYGKFKDIEGVDIDEDTLKNKLIIGQKTLNLLDTNWFYDGYRIKRKKNIEFVQRNLGKLPVIYPEFSLILILYKKIYRKIIKLFITK